MSGESEFHKEKIRTSILIGIGFLILLFILFRERLFFEAKVYGAFGILSVIGLMSFRYVWKRSPHKEPLNRAYIGIDGKPLTGIFIGLAFSAMFIILTQIKVFAGIAQLITPTIPLSLTGSAIVVILLAPIFEEFFFTATIASYLNLYLPFWVSAVLKGIIFAGAHYYAYVVIAHTTLANSVGSFIGAGIFGFLSAYLGKKFGIEASQAGHFGFNAWNFNTVFHLLTVTG